MAIVALSTKTPVSFRTLGRATRTNVAARRVMMPVRAFADGEDTKAAASAAFEDTMAKAQKYWDESEEKPTIVFAGALSLLALYFTNSIVSAVDRLPLVSTVFELIGIFYSGYVAYKYVAVPGEKEALTDTVKGFAKKVGIDL